MLISTITSPELAPGFNYIINFLLIHHPCQQNHINVNHLLLYLQLLQYLYQLKLPNLLYIYYIYLLVQSNIPGIKINKIFTFFLQFKHGSYYLTYIPCPKWTYEIVTFVPSQKLHCYL